MTKMTVLVDFYRFFGKKSVKMARFPAQRAYIWPAPSKPANLANFSHFELFLASLANVQPETG